MNKMLLPVAVASMLLAGLGLFLYPTVSDWLSSRNHSTAVQSYQEAVEELEDGELAAQRQAAEAYNDMLTGGSIEDPFIPGSGAVVSADYTAILNIGGGMGTLSIPKIGLELPIYHGTGEETLKKGIGHLEATSLPIGGEGNHSVLTGHRGLPSARLFTDLDQMDEGDLFYLSVLGETLTYRVDQIKVIDPEDTGDLHPVEGEDHVTLLTCTPYAINSHRLLVRGTRIPTGEAEELLTQQMTGKQVPIIAVIRTVAVEAVLALAVILLYLAKRRRKRL